MTSHAQLRTQPAPDAITFQVFRENEALAPDQWALAAPVVADTTRRAAIGELLRLHSEGLAEVVAKALRVPNAALAATPPESLEGLGLPPVVPFHLQVRASGAVGTKGAGLQLRWLKDAQTPVQGASQSGLFLTVGSRRYTIPEPFFSWFGAVDRFNADTTSDVHTRLGALGEVLSAVAGRVLLEGQLQAIRLVTSNALAVRPSVSASGPDFDLVPMRRIAMSREAPDELGGVTEEETLPRKATEEWQRHFRALGSVREVYPAGGGWYVLFPKRLLPALERVKALQTRGTNAEKLDFIRNPGAHLDQTNEPTQEHSDADPPQPIFVETAEYSERVESIGVFTETVLPFIKSSGTEWLPADYCGLRVGDRIVKVAPQELDPLISKVESAMGSSQPTVDHDGVALPATQATLGALQSLRESLPEGALGRQKDANPLAIDMGVTVPDERLVLLVKGNLAELEYVATPRPIAPATPELPSLLQTSPLAHQVEGIKWLQARWQAGERGALLADDMGLGKTLQAIAFIAWAQEATESDKRRPTLIVAPTGLLRNWQAEITKHLAPPHLGLMHEAHGAALAKLRLPGATATTEQASGVASLDVSTLRRASAVLTTYEALRDYQISFGQIRWGVMILDEAQKIKSPTILMTRATKGMNADFTIAMTGTPVENTLQDLWSIVDCVAPGRLGALRGFLDKWEPEEGAGSDLKELQEQLMNQEPALMLRRMKQDHLKGLPRIHLHKIDRIMPEEQAAAYDHAVIAARSKGAGKSGMLEALAKIRAVSLVPRAYVDADHDAFFKSSARLSAVAEILDNVHGAGERALVFLESLDVLGVLAQRIQERYRLHRPPMIISGSVTGPERQRRVDAFQDEEGFGVMLLSPRAGGVGITLTSANHVIHLGRWWNPAVEDQCTDRAYRIGQRKDVHVYLPLAVHPALKESSFDCTLHGLLERKRALSRTLLAPIVESESDIKNLYDTTVG